VPDPGRDARRLLAHVLKVPPGRLTLFLPEPVSDEIGEAFTLIVERRAARVPISHLIGRRTFYGREFIVTSDALDPRPETETLIEAALTEPFASVLDLGTGTGCILLSLLAERPSSYGTGVELSRDALGVAFWNRNALRLEARAELLEGSWFAPIAAEMRYDLIVSNPPYIAAAEMAGLDPDVREHEPHMALTDGGDGLSAYRLICAEAPRHLEPGGRLIVEIGPTQAAAVRTMMGQAGLTDCATVQDMDGRDRVVIGRSKREFSRK